MKTDTTQFDNISAMMDGELSDAQWELAVAKLGNVNNHEGKQTWDIYHQIGDVLHSDDLAVRLSPDFSSRFSALLNAEPVVLAPKIAPVTVNEPLVSSNVISLKQPRFSRYMAMTSMAAAAAVAFFMAPQIIPLFGAQPNSGLMVSKMEQPIKSQPDGIQLASNPSLADVPHKPNEQIEMLRDPRLDSYLLAHQKFSPAIGNGTQFVTRANAVSATPAASEK
ncbi:MAG: sigma-E factor negative regulatory protein [Undibacterium sp.]|jgi:sigma-E factor negative regulatory protein RseA|nr:sigma-E factor negative regulatory protein [Undibacterium sp.]